MLCSDEHEIGKNTFEKWVFKSSFPILTGLFDYLPFEWSNIIGHYFANLIMEKTYDLLIQ